MIICFWKTYSAPNILFSLIVMSLFDVCGGVGVAGVHSKRGEGIEQIPQELATESVPDDLRGKQVSPDTFDPRTPPNQGQLNVFESYLGRTRRGSCSAKRGASAF